MEKFKNIQINIDSEAILKFLTNSENAIIMVSKKGVLFANIRFDIIFNQKYSKMSRDQLLKQKMSPNINRIIRKYQEEVIKNKNPIIKIPYFLKNRNKIILDIQVQNIFFFNEPALMITVRDITAYEMLQIEIEKSNLMLRDFIDSADYTIGILDSNFNYILLNSQSLKARKVKMESIRGKSFFDFYPKHKKKKVLDIFTFILKTGKSVKLEEHFFKPQVGEKSIILHFFKVGDGIGFINNDITNIIKEKKKHEKEKFEIQYLLDQLPEIIFVKNKMNKIVRYNKKLLDTFGLKKEIFDVKTTEELFQGEEERYLPEEKRIYETGIPFKDIEESATLPNGKTRWYLSKRYPYKNLDGQTTGILRIAIDITDKKKLQDTLIKNNQKFESFIDAANDGFMLFNNNLDLEKINVLQLNRFKKKREDMIGKNIESMKDFINPTIIKLLIKTKKTGESQTIETKTLPKTNGVSHVLIKFFPSGNGFGVVITDISELKKKQFELSKRIKELDALYKIKNLTTKLDLSENDFFNKTVNIINKTMQFPEISHVRIVVLETEYKSNNYQKNEYTFESKIEVFRKKVGFIEINLDLSDPKNQKLVFIEEEKQLIRNVSLIINTYLTLKQLNHELKEHVTTLDNQINCRTIELRKAEEKIIQSERLAILGEVSGMVSHDLRNPLQSISNAVFILKQKLKNDKNAENQKYFDIIEKSIEKSNVIISEILDFSKKIKLDKTMIKVDTLINSCLKFINIPKNIKIKLNLLDKPSLIVDVSKLNRVFTNLIKNSIEAMPKGGRITISSKKIGSKIAFSITDTGIGISEENMKKLGDILQTTKKEGTGFGLAISKRFIKAHKGEISIQSKVGKGTTITITLPLKIDINRNVIKNL
ncbi:MAG: ATP-binding protein [Candidatus Ranarchaeia archaeon]